MHLLHLRIGSNLKQTEYFQLVRKLATNSLSTNWEPDPFNSNFDCKSKKYWSTYQLLHFLDWIPSKWSQKQSDSIADISSFINLKCLSCFSYSTWFSENSEISNSQVQRWLHSIISLKGKVDSTNCFVPSNQMLHTDKLFHSPCNRCQKFCFKTPCQQTSKTVKTKFRLKYQKTALWANIFQFQIQILDCVSIRVSILYL